MGILFCGKKGRILKFERENSVPFDGNCWLKQIDFPSRTNKPPLLRIESGLVWPHTFLFSELISQLPRHQSQARSEVRRKNRVWLGRLLLRSQGLCQLTPHFYIHCFLFVKRNIDLPGGQFNDPLLGKHFFLPFLPATRLSLSQTLEGLFWADLAPFKGSRHTVHCFRN